MKKLLLPIAILLLLGASIYAVNSYNNDNKNNQQGKEDISASEEALEEESNTNNNINNPEKDNETTTSPDNRVLAWDFTFKNLKGEEVTLSDFRGKKVFLNFWASWCGPCRLEMPDIEKLYKELNPEEAVIIAVNIGEDNSTVSTFLRDNNLTFPIALDTISSSPYHYNLQGIPTTFIIDEEGYIVAKYSGYMELSTMREAMGL